MALISSCHWPCKPQAGGCVHTCEHIAMSPVCGQRSYVVHLPFLSGLVLWSTTPRVLLTCRFFVHATQNTRGIVTRQLVLVKDSLHFFVDYSMLQARTCSSFRWNQGPMFNEIGDTRVERTHASTSAASLPKVCNG